MLNYRLCLGGSYRGNTVSKKSIYILFFAFLSILLVCHAFYSRSLFLKTLTSEASLVEAKREYSPIKKQSLIIFTYIIRGYKFQNFTNGGKDLNKGYKVCYNPTNPQESELILNSDKCGI